MFPNGTLALHATASPTRLVVDTVAAFVERTGTAVASTLIGRVTEKEGGEDTAVITNQTTTTLDEIPAHLAFVSVDSATMAEKDADSSDDDDSPPPTSLTLRGRYRLARGVAQPEERHYTVDVDYSKPDAGFFNFSEHAATLENVAAHALAEVVRRVGQTCRDLDDSDAIEDVNFSFERKAWTRALRALNASATKGASERRRVSSSSRYVFDGDVLATPLEGARVKARIRAMLEGDAVKDLFEIETEMGGGDDDDGDGDINLEIDLVSASPDRKLVRHRACDPGSGRSDDTGVCGPCDDGNVSPDGVRCEPCEQEGSDGTSNAKRTECSCKPGYESVEGGARCRRCRVDRRRFSKDGKTCRYCPEEAGEVSEEGDRCVCKEGYEEEDGEEGRCEWVGVEEEAAATGGGDVEP
eukprot:g4026.t1